MNLSTRIKVTQTHVTEVINLIGVGGQISNVSPCNKVNETAYAEQSQEPYITADEARALVKAGGQAEWQGHAPHWYKCDVEDLFNDTFSDGRSCKYRAIKQPEPVEPTDHIKLLGEIYGFLQSTCPVGYADEAFHVVPEPLRAQATAPYAEPSDKLGERVRPTQEAGRAEVEPTCQVKNLVKLDGELVTREAATTAWKTKAETHVMWFKFRDFQWTDVIGHPEDYNKYFLSSIECEYQLCPKPLKQVSWKDVPVGVMTNKGELRNVFGIKAIIETAAQSEHGYTSLEHLTCTLELAPASEQHWIVRHGTNLKDIYALKGIDVTCKYVISDLFLFKVTGIAEGYELK